MLDFHDLLDRARHLLTDPRHNEVRAQLSAHLRLLLVDEFQDTDPVQVELVSALCGESIADGKLFFVGDYKQSIYRFRGADPHVFRRLRDRTPRPGQLSLTLNFRSQPAILDFVNALFADALGPDNEALRPNRSQPTPTPAIEFLWAPGRSGRAREQGRGCAAARPTGLPAACAQILDSQDAIVGDEQAAAQGRPPARAARPGDVAILLRALSDIELYEAALQRYGIDYYLVGGHAFYAQQEVFDLLNLLRSLHSPSDLVSLAGVLRSGFFALLDETIFWLAQHPGGLSAGLFAGEYPAEITAAEQLRARFAADTLDALRAAKDRLRICELIDEALARTGYDAALLNEFLGERKLANLRKLVEQARGFQRGGFLGLSDFIAQLADFVARQPDEALAATHSENTDVVRLMTIHQAKGLEFPIVILPDLDRPRHNRSTRVHFDAALGPLVNLPDDGPSAPPLSGYDLWRFVEREEERCELDRLLYVATTRAADYLILASGVPRLGAAGGPWTQLLARRFDLITGAFIGQADNAALRGNHRDDESAPTIRVTTEEPVVERGVDSRRAHVDWDQIAEQVSQSVPALASDHRATDPVAPDLNARRQYSFSRLAGTLHPRHETPDTVESPISETVDALGLGTLVHAVLAAVEFGRPADVDGLARLYAERQLPGNQAAVDEALALIEPFMKSARARQVAAAVESHAEVEFLLAWPPDDPAPDGILLNGFIDRLYQDAEGDWHVLDFKTNRVADDVAPQAAAYEMQMLVYALAVERILGRAPKSLTLHFLRTGAEYSFAWNAAARERVIKLVNQGIVAAASIG